MSIQRKILKAMISIPVNGEYPDPDTNPRNYAEVHVQTYARKLELIKKYGLTRKEAKKIEVYGSMNIVDWVRELLGCWRTNA